MKPVFVVLGLLLLLGLAVSLEAGSKPASVAEISTSFPFDNDETEQTCRRAIQKQIDAPASVNFSKDFVLDVTESGYMSYTADVNFDDGSLWGYEQSWVCWLYADARTELFVFDAK